MASFLLTDTAHDHRPEVHEIGPADVGAPPSPAWTVHHRTLRGGRREGVDVVAVDNGRLGFTVVPTRGMGLWAAHLGARRVGWRSPVADGPVNPAFVDEAARGGLGWLRGFDELMVRCGLESNGPPLFDDAGHVVHGLHGRIANRPAHRVAVHVDDRAPHAITIEGEVDEAELFFCHLRLATRISTVPGSNRLTVRDEISNRGDRPAGFQLLYHWNFGPPVLEEGSRLVAPVREVSPRNARAAEGIGHHTTYGPPEPGFPEQVYLMTLHAGDDGMTAALLRNRAGDHGVALRFDVRQLPCFTQWVCTQGMKEGYVTGLEPAVNYPNPRPYEAAHGRVRMLDPGASHVAETRLEVLEGRDAVAAVESEVEALRRRGGTPIVHERPAEPFTDGA